MITLPPSRPLTANAPPWLRALRAPALEHPLARPTLVTERLTLRPYRADDAEQWFAIQSEPAINRFMNWPDRDRESSLRHLRDRMRHTRFSVLDDFLALAVELDGRLIGDVSLRLKCVRPTGRNVEVSWLLHPDYEGYGYAVEAASAALTLAFDHVHARWAVAYIDVHNPKSIALAERLNLRAVPLDATTIAYFGSPATYTRSTAKVTPCEPSRSELR